MALKRMAITVAYDGTAYSGFQRQQNAPSIQGEIEKVLKRVTGTHITVNGASRTDAGVHARGQCAHFDTTSNIPAEKYPFVFNTQLPRDIRITEARVVSEVFHARFSSRGKIYTYRIHNARHADALLRNLTAHVPVPIDVGKMQDAAKMLLGTRDFAGFCATGSNAKTTVRTLSAIDIAQDGPLITLTVQGNAFLYNMVRIITGTLIEIGQDKRSPDCLLEALETKNRLVLGITAPAHGLELTKIFYDENNLVPFPITEEGR